MHSSGADVYYLNLYRRRGKQAAPRTQPLRIGVPMGTVVKRKRGGALLGELTNPGEILLVARGGKGGLGVVRPAAQPAAKGRGKFLDEVSHGCILSISLCSLSST